MIGSGLKKLAAANGMKVANGVAYGSLCGYAATMFEGAGYKSIVFTTKFIDLEKKNAFMEAVGNVNVEKQFRVRSLNLSTDKLEVVFLDNPGTMKKIEDFIAWLIPLLREGGATPANVCMECGCEVMNGRWVLIDGVARYMHDSCAQKVKREIDESNQQKKEADDGSYITGAFGALLGAILGAILWALVLVAGYVASIVGLAMGWLADKGYNLLRGKQDKMKVVILIIAVIAGVLLGTVAGYFAQVVMANEDLAMAEIVDWFFTLLEDPEFVGYIVKDVLFGLLFAALGVAGVIRNAGKEVADAKYIELE